MMKVPIALVLLGASFAFAADAPVPTADPAPADANAPANKAVEGKPADKAPAPEPKVDPNKTVSPDTFVPSESISEDLAVPLPVDI